MSSIDALVDLIEQVSGIVVIPRETERLAAIATERATATGQRDLTGYVRYLADRRDGDELRELLARITVNESSLFRGAQQFRALAEQIVPRLAATRPGRRLRLWSAGCARGEEAASLAIVLAESVGLTGWDWRILASDVNEAVLDQARRARFGRRAMARVEPEIAVRYFRSRDGELELVPELRERIVFRAVNLVDDSLSLPDAPFDVVLLRNVLIYFRPPAQRRVVERVAATMAADGALFVGPSESLWQLHTGLEPEDLGDCFCYRRPDAADPTVASAERDAVGSPGRGSQPARRRDPSPLDADSSRPASAAAIADELAVLIDAGRRDRAVRRSIRASRSSPDDPALRALEGLAWERADEPERAVSAYRAALYLEPRLVDVRFLLAGCLDRLGRTVRAQRERRSLIAAVAGGGVRIVPELRRLGAPTLTEIEVQLKSQETTER